MEFNDDSPVPPTTELGLESLRSHWKALHEASIRAATISTGMPIFIRGTPGEHAPEVLLASEIVVFGSETNEGQLIERVGISFAAILRELERDAEFLLRFDPRQFEEIIAAAYTREGCEVTLTPRSGDGGRDVIAIYPKLGRIRILDQVKRYKPNNEVPANDVRALLGVLSLDASASKGVVTTTSHFAPGVFKEFAQLIPTRLELKDGKQVHEWIKRLAEREGK